MTDPPAYRIEWSARAVSDLSSIDAYISLFAPQTATRFTARLIAAVESLAGQPDRGRAAGRLRELVAISPYVVRYRVVGDTVQVLRIRHGAQRPD